MKRKIISLAIVGTLLVSSTSLAYANTTSYNKYNYLETVKEDNFDLKQINDKLEDELKEYRVALRARSTIEEMSLKDFDDNYDDSASRLTASQVKLYNHIKEGKEYHDKYVEQQQKLNEILLQGEANYYGYKFAERNLNNRTESFNLIKTKYDTKVLEHELGKISDIDLMSFEKTYNDSFAAQLEASNAFEQSKNNFNRYISQPINTEVNLDDIDINLPEYKLESIDSTLEKMIANSYQMSSLTLELERLKADRTLKGRYSGFGNTKIELENLRISIEEIEKQLKELNLDLEYQLRTKYNDTMAADNKFKSAELTLEIERNKLKIAKIKNENAMISSLDFVESQQNYDDALNAYFNAKLTAYKSIKTFNDFVELNTTPVFMDFK